MRKAPAVLLLGLTVPVLSALPVLSPPAAPPKPVAPHVHELALAGVDAAALASGAGRSSLAASQEARAELTDPTARGRNPQQRPTVFTGARHTQSFQMLGVTWRNGSADDVTVLVRTHTRGRWTGWTSLERADVDLTRSQEATAPRTGTEPYYAGPSDGVQVRVDVRQGPMPQDLRVELIDPGSSAADARVGQAPAASAAAVTGQPTIYTRSQWGADESLRTSAPRYSPTILGGFVHHTDGANGYASADVPKIIRGIYAYHVLSNGWSDIGYNFLVDRFGRLWEGRYGGIDRPVIGAHTGGFNYDTFGIAAIGNYDTVGPPSAMVDAIARLMAWKLSLHYRNPAGTMTLTAAAFSGSRYAAGTLVTKPVVSGHRDMDYTTCPGQYLYSQLTTIRSKVVAYVGPGLVNPVIVPSATSVKVTSGVVKSGQGWRVELRDGTSGAVVRRVSGTGSINVTLPYLDASGIALRSGPYVVHIDSWYGSTPARAFDQQLTVNGATESDAATLADGSLLVASRTQTNGIIVQTRQPDGTFTAPIDLNGLLFGRPGLGLTSTGDPVVAVRGTDNRLYVQRRAADGTWPRSWERVDSLLGGGPAIVSDGAGALQVLARGSDGALWGWVSSAPGRWSVGTSLGGAISAGSAVGAARTADGVLHVAVHGVDNHGWYRRNVKGVWDRSFTALGGVLKSDVDLAPADDSDVMVVVWGTNNYPYFIRKQPSTVPAWSRLGALPIAVPPSLAAPGATSPLTAVSRTLDNRQVSNAYVGGIWGSWSPLG